MNDEQLAKRILTHIEHHKTDLGAYRDLYSLCTDIIQNESGDAAFAHRTNKQLRIMLRKNGGDDENYAGFYDLYRKSLLLDAPVDFDAYMLYLEIDRQPKKQFYLPRRKQLLPVVACLQDLVDDKLDELFLSMPPRVGKTCLTQFFVTFIMGREPDISNLYSAFSDTITSAFYNGLLEILTDADTYKWGEVFPDCKIVKTKADDEIIDLNRRKRYPSVTCRSLYGTLNGACDCTGFQISDDLLSGIDEAKSPDRLKTAWDKVDNNFLPRSVGDRVKRLWIGARWSIYDPIGIRIDLLENDPRFRSKRYRVFNIPALNEHDESNFDYKYGKGLSTQELLQRRASFERNGDMASWLAQYMGTPIEREGTVFSPEQMQFFNGVLPDETHLERVYFAVDPSWGGGDFTAGPVVFQYDDGLLYVPDVIYNASEKTVTRNAIVSKAIKYGVDVIYIEANKMTADYAEGVSDIIKDRRENISVTTTISHYTNTGKQQRIFDKAPDIREHFVFLDSGYRSKEYELFMQNVFSFKVTGRNKHDDAPDSLTIAYDKAFTKSVKPFTFQRLF